MNKDILMAAGDYRNEMRIAIISDVFCSGRVFARPLLWLHQFIQKEVYDTHVTCFVQLSFVGYRRRDRQLYSIRCQRRERHCIDAAATTKFAARPVATMAIGECAQCSSDPHVEASRQTFPDPRVFSFCWRPKNLALFSAKA